MFQPQAPHPRPNIDQHYHTQPRAIRKRRCLHHMALYGNILLFMPNYFCLTFNVDCFNLSDDPRSGIISVIKLSVLKLNISLFLSIEWNSIRLGGPVHGLVTKTVHKTLPGSLS